MEIVPGKGNCEITDFEIPPGFLVVCVVKTDVVFSNMTP